MIRPTPRTSAPRGPRKSASAQLSAKQRALLAFFLQVETELLSGPHAEETRNMGVPWDAALYAELLRVKVPSVSRMLGNLEERRLIACWATGSGRGRRIHSVKLSAEAVKVAQLQSLHGKSAPQLRREQTAAYTAAQRELMERFRVTGQWGRLNLAAIDRAGFTLELSKDKPQT